MLCFAPVCFTVRNSQGQIKLYSKGADTIIFERLDPSSEDLMYTTSEHLSVRVVLLVNITQRQWVHYIFIVS